MSWIRRCCGHSPPTSSWPSTGDPSTRRWREVDHHLFDDSDTQTDVTVGATEDGPYLLVVAYLTPEWTGTDANGESLYYHPVGAAYLELTADPADARALAAAAQAVLDRLGAVR